jgi:hypothetical protein
MYEQLTSSDTRVRDEAAAAWHRWGFGVRGLLLLGLGLGLGT